MMICSFAREFRLQSPNQVADFSPHESLPCKPHQPSVVDHFIRCADSGQLYLNGIHAFLKGGFEDAGGARARHGGVIFNGRLIIVC